MNRRKIFCANVPVENNVKLTEIMSYLPRIEHFIEKGQKYHRVNTFSKTLAETSPKDLISLAKRLSCEIRKRESRITICEVSAEMAEELQEFSNSRGIALKSRSNYVILSCSVNIAQGEEIESAFKVKIFSDLSDLDENAFVDSIVRTATAKLGSHSIPSGKYDVLFDKNVVPYLLKPLLQQLSAFSVKEHLSLFEGKLEEQVLSKKLTILENPHSKTPFAYSFDDEGMPSQKKMLFNRGVLKTYLYDLETAQNANTQSTGNGTLKGGNIRPDLGFVEVKAGRKTFEETLADLKKAVYITDIQGIHTGLNTSSGDYSLQAEGFLVENGKITHPISLITVAGNLLTDFAKVSQVANDVELSIQGFLSPSLVIKKLAISGN